MPDKNNNSRRKFLKGVSAVGLTLAGTGLATASKNNSPKSDDWKVPDRLLDDDVKRVVKMHPEKGFKNAKVQAGVVDVYKLVKTDGTASVLKVGQFDTPVEYDLYTDLENKSYRIEGVSEVAASEITQMTSTTETSPQDVSTANSQSNYSVQIMQHDPVECKLCRTNQTLVWSHDGSSSSFVSRSKEAKAWSPTGCGTNWYRDTDRWDGEPSVIDGGRTVASTNEGGYYNYNFRDDSKVTNVDHSITIEGYQDGGAYYIDVVNKSGEYSGLLHSHTTAG